MKINNNNNHNIIDIKKAPSGESEPEIVWLEALAARSRGERDGRF